MVTYAGFQLRQALVLSQFLGKIVAQLGNGALFDGFDRHFIGNRLARQFRFRIIGRVDDFCFQLLTRLGAAQNRIEGFYGVLAANFDERILPGDRRRIGLALNLAGVGDLRPVAIDERAVFFDGLDGGARFAELGHLLLKFFVRQFSGGFFDRNVLVALNGESRYVFESSLDVQRLAIFHRKLGNLRLPYGIYTQLAHALVETLRQQAVDDFLADLRGETPADDRLGNFAGTKPGNAGVLLIIPRHIAEGFRYVFGRNVEHQFAGAIRIQNRTVRVCMAVFVIVVMRGDYFRRGGVFDGVSGTQLFLPSGRDKRQRNCRRRSGAKLPRVARGSLQFMVRGFADRVKPRETGLPLPPMRRSRNVTVQ